MLMVPGLGVGGKKSSGGLAAAGGGTTLGMALTGKGRLGGMTLGCMTLGLPSSGGLPCLRWVGMALGGCKCISGGCSGCLGTKAGAVVGGGPSGCFGTKARALVGGGPCKPFQGMEGFSFL